MLPRSFERGANEKAPSPLEDSVLFCLSAFLWIFGFVLTLQPFDLRGLTRMLPP